MLDGPDNTLRAKLMARAAGTALLGTGWLLQRLPDTCTRMLAWLLAGMWSTILPVRRKVAKHNLELAFGDMLTDRITRKLLHRIAYLLFINYLEFLTLPFISGPVLVSRFRWQGLENLEAALKRGKGAFILSAHLGAFDQLAAATAARGYSVTIVSRTPRSRIGELIWMRYRRNAGIHILPEKRSLSGVLRALRRGDLVVMVLDQNMNRDRGLFVQFFGRPACTLDSLAVLALRTGTPVVPAFTWRGADGKHDVVFMPEADLVRTGNIKADVTENTQYFTTQIETMIRAHPEQWLWLHRRWKTQPLS